MRRELRVFLKLLSYCLGVFAVALMMTRAYLMFVDTHSSGNQHWTRTRLREITEAIDSLPSKPPANVFFGASEVEVGINPIALDEQLLKKGLPTESYNFGIRNATGHHVELLASRLYLDMKGKKDSVGFSVFFFTPLRNTKDFFRQISKYGNFSNVSTYSSIIYTGEMLLPRLRSFNKEAFSTAFLKYAYGSVSPDSAMDELDEFIRARMSFSLEGKNFRDVMMLKYSIWSDPVFYQAPPWNPSTRGWHFFGYPETREALAPLLTAFDNPEVLRKSNIIDATLGGGWNFDFDENLIADFEQAIITASAISQHTLLIYYPELMDYAPPQGLQAISQTLREVSRTTGATLIDYSVCRVFQKSDYLDGTHLNIQGQAKLSALLAEDIFEMTQATAPHRVPRCYYKQEKP